MAFLWTGPPAQAQGCYPPPCGQTTLVVRGVSQPGPDLNASLLSSPGRVDHRTAAPFALAGLLMVMVTLTTLCLRRRAAMAAPTPAVVTAAVPSARANPQRSLR